MSMQSKGKAEPLSTFWLPKPVDSLCPALSHNEMCDIAIIGGGISGLSTAIHIKLMEPGTDVIIFDSGRIGYGPSGLSSGQCAPRVGPGIKRQLKQYGNEVARSNYQFSLTSVEYLRSFINCYDIHSELEETEQLQISLSHSGSKRNRITHDCYKSLGVELKFLDKRKLNELFCDSNRIIDAISFPSSFINPGLFCTSLKKLAIRLGVRIYENTHINLNEAIENNRVNVNGFFFTSKKIVLAVDSDISSVRKLPSVVHPILTFATVTSSLSLDALDSLGEYRKYGFYDNRKYFNFIRPVSNGRILVGGEYQYGKLSGLKDGVNEKIKKSLMRNLKRVFPSLNDVKAEYTWSGVAGCTLTEWPVVAPLGPDERCWQIGGWNGHGIALGFYTGKQLASRLLNLSNPFPVPWEPNAGFPIPKYLARISLSTYLSYHRLSANLLTN